MPNTQLRATPRRVDPVRNLDDFACALNATFGFSTNYIVVKTGLTPSQVGYRLKMFNIKRRDYRDGESIGARAVMRVARNAVGPELATYLRRTLGTPE